jgi:lipoprotein NlpI
VLIGALLSIPVIAATAVVLSAASADDAQICRTESGDVAVVACTRAIASGRYRDDALAVLYNNRGVAYHEKADVGRGFLIDDLDRAIADYDEAIRLEPKFARAHNNRGLSYRQKGDLDRAIADCDEAIRLDPRFAPAYNNRGAAYQAKRDLDRAMADYNESIRLDPKYAPAYNKRGFAWSLTGDFDRAIADLDEAIQLDPRDSTAYLSRGRANVFIGALPKALADLDRAAELAPKAGYPALWLDIARRRSNLPSRLAEDSRQIDITDWPGPLIQLYLGEQTREEALHDAAGWELDVPNGQLCEANFYIAELDLLQGRKDDAVRFFQRALARCSKVVPEYQGAAAELKALGASQ